MSVFLAQLKSEVRLVLRNGEQLLLTLGIPVMLLIFFSLVDVLPTGESDPINFLAPGVLSLAVMSTAMVSLGISTGFERSYHVFKRLGLTPLGTPRLIASKICTVLVVEIVQFVVLIPVALLLGWEADAQRWSIAILGILLGTAAMGGIGLAIAGRLRAEINLAAQNGLYLLLMLMSGMVFPLTELPLVMRGISRALPSTALADLVREGLSNAGTRPGFSLIVLAAWAVVAPVVAAISFRWD